MIDRDIELLLQVFNSGRGAISERQSPGGYLGLSFFVRLRLIEYDSLICLYHSGKLQQQVGLWT